MTPFDAKTSVTMMRESLMEYAPPSDEMRVNPPFSMRICDVVVPIDRWRDMPRGGHFGEWEEPELLADDIRTFFASISNA